MQLSIYRGLKLRFFVSLNMKLRNIGYVPNEKKFDIWNLLDLCIESDDCMSWEEWRKFKMLFSYLNDCWIFGIDIAATITWDREDNYQVNVRLRRDDNWICDLNMNLLEYVQRVEISLIEIERLKKEISYGMKIVVCEQYIATYLRKKRMDMDG